MALRPSAGCLLLCLHHPPSQVHSFVHLRTQVNSPCLDLEQQGGKKIEDSKLVCHLFKMYEENFSAMKVQGRQWNSLLFYKKINILVPWFLVSSLLLSIFVLWRSQLLWTFSVEGGLWTIWALMCFIDRKIVVSVFCDPSVYIVITSQDSKTKMIFKKPSEALIVPFIT